jgi:hypothetical protein
MVSLPGVIFSTMAAAKNPAKLSMPYIA